MQKYISPNDVIVRSEIQMRKLIMNNEKKRRLETSFCGTIRADMSNNIPTMSQPITRNGKKCW